MLNFTVTEIAQHVGGTVLGDGSLRINGLAGLADACSGALTFLANPKYAAQLKETRASAVIVGRDIASAPCTLIQTDLPDLAFGKAAALLAGPTPRPTPGISATATVSAQAQLGREVTVGPGAVIESGAKIGDRTTIYANAYIGQEVIIGEDCLIYPGVALYHRVTLGKRVTVHANSVIGSDGFGYAWDGRQHAKIPQIGTVVIGDDVEIGACTTIDRARFGQTIIGPGAKIDNLVQIAHNVKIGACSIIVSQVGISGSTTLGNGVIVGGQVGFVGHVDIGDRATFSAQAGVTKSVPAGQHYSGHPASPHEAWLTNLRNIKALPRLRETVRTLEERIKKLEDETANA